MKVGGKYIPGAFINFTRKGRRKIKSGIQVMARNQKETWRPGYVGWMFKKGQGAHARAPFRVISYSIDPFAKEIDKIVQIAATKHYEAEFNRAFQRRLARAATRK